MAEYDSSRAVAARLIAKRGRLITLRKTSRTLANAAKPWDGMTENDTDITVKGVILENEVVETGDTLVPISDQIAYVAPSTVELANANADLETYDQLIDSGTVAWKINKVEELKPGDDSVLFKIFIGK